MILKANAVGFEMMRYGNFFNQLPTFKDFVGPSEENLDTVWKTWVDRENASM